MAKKNIVFLCDNCGDTSLNWVGKCPSCGAWNSLKPFSEPDTATSSSSNKNVLGINKGNGFATISKISKIEASAETRISTRISELDRVLGGGIVVGSVILIGGEPGIGKSTLLLQVSSNISKDKEVIYFTGEESLEQIKLRAKRLNIENSSFYVSSESNCETIINTIIDKEPSLVVIDSIQTVYSPNTNSIAGSPAQIKNSAWALMQLAKQKNIAIFLVGHITKDGAIAGPKILEHIVDSVLYFEGDGKGIYRIVRAFKNRFGAIDEVGIFEMNSGGLNEVVDASKIFINGNNSSIFAGNVITPVIEGSRVFCVQQEALVASSAFGYPRRLTMGFDTQRLLIIIAILEKRAKLSLSNQDVYINVAHGLSIEETASDLSTAMAIVSSMTGIAIPITTTFIGELGLSGEIRSVRFIDRRVKEMKKFGLKEVYVPKGSAKEIKDKDNLKIFEYEHISDLVKKFLHP